MATKSSSKGKKKSTQRTVLYSKYLIFAAALVFVANLPLYIQSLRIGVEPRTIYLGFIFLCLSFVMILGDPFKVGIRLVWYVGWYTLFIAVCVGSLLMAQVSPLAMDTFMSFAWMAGISCSFALLAHKTQSLKPACYGVLAAVCLMCAINFYEFLNPGYNAFVDQLYDEVKAEGIVTRIGGMHKDPNTTGYAIVLGSFLSLIVVPRKFRLLLLLVAGLAVLVTVSRSALMLWVFAFVFSLYCGLIGRGTFISYFWGIGGIVLLILLLLSGKIPDLVTAANLESYVNKNMMTRLSGDFLNQDDNSSSDRKDLAKGGLEKFLDSPVLGNGLGATRPTPDSYGTHNMFVLFGAELGMVGLIVYTGLLVVAVFTGAKIGGCFVLLLFFASLFSHTIMSVGGVFAVLLAIAVVLTPAQVVKVRLVSKTIMPNSVGALPGKRRRKRRKAGVEFSF